MQQPAWKKHQVKRKWQSIVSVFITVTLLFAIVNGLAKGFSFKNQISKSRWDGKSSMAVAINSKNPSLFIFQNDPKAAVVLTVGKDVFYQTGNDNEVLKSATDNTLDFWDELTKTISHTYGAKVDNYLILGSDSEMKGDFSKKLLIDFASITTPIKLVTVGWTDNVKSTNITRLDALRLWWQLKSISVENLSFVDLSSYTAEIINKENKKVLGADTVSLNRVVRKYLENITVVDENKKIKVLNGAKDTKAANLAASFIESVGGNVVEVSGSDSEYTQTQIVAKDKKSYTANYLAKMFNCDINGAQNLQNEQEITVIIGSDFANFYFE